MTVALSSILGGAFRTALARAVSEAGEGAQEAAQMLEEASHARPRILGISSETWYGYRMAQASSWEDANAQLASDLDIAIYRTYLNLTGTAGTPPFAVSVVSSQEGVQCLFHKAPMSTGISRQQCYMSAVGAMRELARAYVRIAASGVRV